MNYNRFKADVDMLIVEVQQELESNVDHGVGSFDHFQESVILIMIHYCLNSHIICLDK